MSDPASRFTQGAPRLHYLEWRAGQTPALIALHGNSANAWWWRPIAEALGEGGPRLIALDQRGHGDSEWVRPPAYAPNHYAADLDRLIADLAIDRPIVVGHSMGGMSALAFGVEYPRRAAAIVVIDSAITSTDRRNRFLRRLQSLPVVNYPDLETALARFRLMPREGDIAPQILAEIARRSLTSAADGRWSMKFDRESFFGSDGIDVAAAIARVEVPILLIRAAESRIMMAEAAERAVASNPKARLVTIPNAHHHVILERPAEVAAVLAHFIRRLAAPA